MKIILSIGFRHCLCCAVLFLIAAAPIEGIAGTAKPGLPDGNYSPSETAENEWQQARQILHAPKEGPVPLYAENHYPEAVRLLESAAQKGHSKSTLHLGSLYLCGKGVEMSMQNAFRYYIKAIQLFLKKTLLTPILTVLSILLAVFIPFKIRLLFRNAKTTILTRWVGTDNPRLQYKLALRYIHGKGTSKRWIEARKLLEKAADQNYAPAQVELGRFFRDGIIVQASRVKAAEWFLKGAEQGDKEGLFLAGSCYEQGAGVPLYLPKALGFYALATARGHRDAPEKMALCDKKMTNAQKTAGRTFAEAFARENGFTWSAGSTRTSGKDRSPAADRKGRCASDESSTRRDSREAAGFARRAGPHPPACRAL